MRKIDTIICAVRTKEEFDVALTKPSKMIFLLRCNILEVDNYIAEAKRNDKELFVHIDLMDGIGRDNAAIKFLANKGLHGIISTRQNIVRFAVENGLSAVQRFFILDSQSIDTAFESVRAFRPSMIEIMPGIMPSIIKRFLCLHVPIIAGGLISTKEQIIEAISIGAAAVSTSKKELWVNKI